MKPQLLQYSSSMVAGSVGVGWSKYNPVTDASCARKNRPKDTPAQAPHTAIRSVPRRSRGSLEHDRELETHPALLRPIERADMQRVVIEQDGLAEPAAIALQADGLDIELGHEGELPVHFLGVVGRGMVLGARRQQQSGKTRLAAHRDPYFPSRNPFRPVKAVIIP